MNRLSIVMQGPVREGDRVLPDVLRHIHRTRLIFPEAELIVSTWHATPVADQALYQMLASDGVRLVLSDDPGALSASDGQMVYHTNLNRMLRASQAGLAAATRPLAVKIRTDTWLSERRLLLLLDSYILTSKEGVPRNPEYRVFRARVINASWFARDARGSLPYLYHPGDILLAGLTEDIRLFFSAPEATASLFHPDTMPGLWSAWRYVPEQWCWVHAIAAVTGTSPWPGGFDYREADIVNSEQYYLANFVPFSPGTLGLHWPKYWRRYPLRGLFSTYTHRRWRYLARETAGGRFGRSASLPGRLMSGVWRTGYCLRVRMLRQPCIRRVVFRLLGRRP
ncbi:WavE lipopolysaccharide synthesis family protein [Lelliottia nimipressuralis]